jgi:hypothetical protein
VRLAKYRDAVWPKSDSGREANDRLCSGTGIDEIDEYRIQEDTYL